MKTVLNPKVAKNLKTLAVRDALYSEVQRVKADLFHVDGGPNKRQEHDRFKAVEGAINFALFIRAIDSDERCSLLKDALGE